MQILTININYCLSYFHQIIYMLISTLYLFYIIVKQLLD